MWRVHCHIPSVRNATVFPLIHEGGQTLHPLPHGSPSAPPRPSSSGNTTGDDLLLLDLRNRPQSDPDMRYTSPFLPGIAITSALPEQARAFNVMSSGSPVPLRSHRSFPACSSPFMFYFFNFVQPFQSFRLTCNLPSDSAAHLYSPLKFP